MSTVEQDTATAAAQFAELLCADDEFVRSEFEAIVAAAWDEEPPEGAAPRPRQRPGGFSAAGSLRAPSPAAGRRSGRPARSARGGSVRLRGRTPARPIPSSESGSGASAAPLPGAAGRCRGLESR